MPTSQHDGFRAGGRERQASRALQRGRLGPCCVFVKLYARIQRKANDSGGLAIRRLGQFPHNGVNRAIKERFGGNRSLRQVRLGCSLTAMEGGGSLHFCVKPKPQVFFMRLLRNFPGGCRVVFFPRAARKTRSFTARKKFFLRILSWLRAEKFPL